MSSDTKIHGPAIRFGHFAGGHNVVQADRNDKFAGADKMTVLFEFKDQAQWRRYQKKINGMMESLSSEPFHGVTRALFGKGVAEVPTQSVDDGRVFMQTSLTREQVSFIAHHEAEVVKAVKTWRKTEDEGSFDKSFTAEMQAHEYVRKCQYMLRTQDVQGHDLFDVFDVNVTVPSKQKTPDVDGRVTARDIGRIAGSTHRDPDL